MEVIGHIHAPAALLPGKETPLPLSRSGRGGEEEKIPAPTGNRIPVVQPVA
jgi:hypothetical protein